MQRLTLLGLASLALLTLGQAPAPQPPANGAIAGKVLLVKTGKAIPPDDVWVYLEENQPSSIGANVTAKIEQKERKFVPPVVVVPVGATVQFPNRDNQEHNVFSPAKETSSWPGFDLGRHTKPVPPQKGYHRFLVAGELDIFCDMHHDMQAKIKVVPTLHFVKVTSTGAFRLDGIPPGKYRVSTWAPNSKPVRSELVDVRAGATVGVENLNLQAGERPKTHPNKYGAPYDSY